MGTENRDKRKDSSGDDVINLNEVFALLAKLMVVFVLLVVSLRFPLVWIKFPLSFVILALGWRWIFRGKKEQKVSAGRSTVSRKVTVMEPSGGGLSGVKTVKAQDHETVRALIALDAAGEFGKAKTLIQRLDGEEFSGPVGKELAVVAGNYFPIELEPTENGVRFKLV
ncbi:hypothetical protein VSU19_17725 [Verrucomicrobiales bacterium BCK34]|nr:hypothetical protein [Verrucomicrobiales bacterium BCK34]